MPVLLQSGGETALGPLYPESYDVIWTLMIAAIILFMVAAFVRIARSRDLTSTGRAVWAALVLLIPLLGSVAALLLVRRTRSSSSVRSN